MSLRSRILKIERKLTSVVKTQHAQDARVAGLSTRVSRLDSARRALGLPAPRANPKAKHRAVSIELDSETGRRMAFSHGGSGLFERTQKQINLWALSAPKSGGYDKTWFTVTYDDGETYKGRLDLKSWEVADDNNLAQHILYAIRRHPNQKAAKEFLRDYQIGDDETRGNPHVPFPADRFPGLEEQVQAGAARHSAAWWGYGSKKEQKHRRERMAKQGIYPPGEGPKKRSNR